MYRLCITHQAHPALCFTGCRLKIPLLDSAVGAKVPLASMFVAASKAVSDATQQLTRPVPNTTGVPAAGVPRILSSAECPANLYVL